LNYIGDELENCCDVYIRVMIIECACKCCCHYDFS